MRAVRRVFSPPFLWGVAATLGGLWLWRNYGRLFPRLPGGNGG